MRPHRTLVKGFRVWRPFHLEIGKVHLDFGGMSVKRGPFWLPDGLHFWWGHHHYLSLFWSRGAGDTKRIDYGVVPRIPDPPAPALGEMDQQPGESDA